MTPIRPAAFTPVQTPASAGADAARTAAQRAFFDQAMGRAGAPAAPQAPQAAAQVRTAQAAASAPAQAVFSGPREIRPDPAAEAPAKMLRPGSLLDIRV